MGGIDYSRMARLCTRVDQLGASADVKPSVKRVYEERTKAEMAAFLSAHKALTVAEGASRKEAREAVEALEALGQPYGEARAMAAAYLPDAVLPEKLKSLPTDTDRKTSIERLLDSLDDHTGEGWADELLAGAFAQKAGGVLQELDEAIGASTALSAARDARTTAYAIAWDRYIAFKNVVRNVYGPKSAQYRRIHVRANGTLAEEEPAATE